MKQYLNGKKVPNGFYFSVKPVDFQYVSADKEVLMGRKKATTYKRIPSLLMMVVAPAFGGAFVLLFPALVALTILGVLGGTVVRQLMKAVDSTAHYLNDMHFQPAMSYLKWRKGSQQESQELPPEIPAELKDLEEEITKRREIEK